MPSTAWPNTTYRKSPGQLSNEQIQDYLNHLIKERQLAWNTVNVIFSAFRCFYTNVLNWDETRFSIPARKTPKQLPMLLSLAEVKALLAATANLKHQAVLATMYGAGLRVSEAVRLKPAHIESRMRSASPIGTAPAAIPSKP